ncbi:MAG: prolyl oligopeptidase family serine peptidase [Bacillota bacterium]
MAISLEPASSLTRLDLPRGTHVLGRYESRTYTDSAGKTLLYRLFKPDHYDRQRQYPLILFLHGAGGRGNDNQSQVVDGDITATSYASEAIQAKYPCFILAPQCPIDQRWVEVDWSAPTHTQPPQPSQGLQLTMALLSRLQKEFSLDPHRLYVTGISMGGYATWDLIARYPTYFAAAVPVCGGGDETTADRIVRLPIWVFHGAQDPTVPAARSRNMVSAIRRLGGNALYTEYPHVDHHSWLHAYTDPDLLPWLFFQTRTGNTPLMPCA